MSQSALQLDDEDSTPIRGISAVVGRADVRSALRDGTGAEILDWAPMLARFRAKRNKYPVWSVTIGGRPVEVTVYEEGDLWIAENEHYNVVANGESIAEALSEAREAFQYLHDELVNEEDDTLSDFARLLKRRYRLIEVAREA